MIKELKVNNHIEMINCLKEIINSKNETREDFSITFSMYDFLPKNYKMALEKEQPSFALCRIKDEDTVVLFKKTNSIHATINFGCRYWLSKTFDNRFGDLEEDLIRNVLDTIQSQAMVTFSSHFNVFQKISSYLCNLNKLNTQQEMCLKLWEMGADSEHPFKDVKKIKQFNKLDKVIFNDKCSTELLLPYADDGDLNYSLYKYKDIFYVRIEISYDDLFGCKWGENVGYFYPASEEDWGFSMDLGKLEKPLQLIDIINL